nr:zinc finger, CCHC-type [Tanacetum cinerariifolium]
MRDMNPIHTLGDYSKPNHEGYKNTIELPLGNNMDPSQHLKDFLKLVNSLDLDGSITTWEDLTTRFRAQFFPPRRTAKLRNDILMFQQHQGESLSEAWTRFKDLLQKVPHHGIDRWIQIQIFYDHVSFHLKCKIDHAAGGKIHNKKPDESWEIIENLALYDHEGWNDAKEFFKPGLVDNHRFNESLSRARVGKIKGRAYNLLPRRPVYEVILRKKITKKEDIEGNFKIPCNTGGLKHMNALVDQVSYVNVMPLSTYMKLTDERNAETDIRLSLASHSYIYPLRINEDVLVEVAEHVYPVDFIILDIKENENRPFILETPFLTMAKAGEKGIKNNIKTIAPTMTVNRLVLKREEKIKLHQEKEMEFDRMRNKNFKYERPAPVKIKDEVDDEREVTKFLIKNKEEIFTDPGDGARVNS